MSKYLAKEEVGDLETGKRRPSRGGGIEYTFGWKDVSYSVQKQGKPRKILKNVSGRCQPGQMTAIMGPSGSGKTTMLDVLSDRLSSGLIEGSVFVNGAIRKQQTFRSISSYVSQEDALMGCFTPLETLRYAANLSLSSDISSEEKERRVQEAIQDMGLRVCEGTIVGDMFRKGLSGGQKRRLSIAIELLSRPKILLLDEPTSGLDSSSTYNVMKFIQSIAQSGRTVLCTIHQPSSAVYEMFSNLMLLVAGETVFFGSPAEALIHFEKAGYPCPPYSNPAEYFVSLINTDFEGHADVAKLVDNFAKGEKLKEIHEGLKMDEGRGGVDEKLAKALVPDSFAQFKTLLHRHLMNNARNPGIFWVRLVMYFLMSFMVGTMYLYTNEKINEQDMVVMLFFIMGFLVFMSVAVLPFFIDGRGVFMRERVNCSLSVASYVVSNFIAVIPGVLLIAFVSTTTVYSLTNSLSYWLFMINLFLSLIVAESMMHIIGACVPHYILGIAVGAGVYGMLMLNAGFVVPKPSIPSYWMWCHWIAFHKYSFEAFMYEQFHENNSPMSLAIRERYGVDDVDVSFNFQMLGIYSIILQVLYYFILWKFHTGRK